MFDPVVHQKLGELEAKTTASHKRLDKVEINLVSELKGIRDELKELNAHMNRGKGMGFAAMIFAGLSGASLTKLGEFFINK